MDKFKASEGGIMRKILFRGRRLDNGSWETGSLVIVREGILGEQVSIADKMTGYLTAVAPETVGQYTGLTDKNGKQIFEGDIVRLPELYGCGVATIEYCGAAFRACGSAFAYQVSESMAIIGTVHDNPELLED